MAIGAVTARHGVAVALLLDASGADASRAAMLDTSGPSRLPEHMLVEEGMDGGDTLAQPAETGADASDAGDSATGEDTEEGPGTDGETDSGADSGAPEEDREG